MTEIRNCEVCGGADLTSVLDLGLHPLCDDLVPEGDERVCERYPIHIFFCAACGTAHQKHQVPKRVLFPTSYHYRSRFTADVLSGMEDLVQSCAEQLNGLEGRLVLDIGCNDGSLLNAFRARGARTAGIEPTGAVAEARLNHQVIQDYFGPNCVDTVLRRFGVPDLITFTNVFAHIENLGEILDALRQISGPRTLIVIENHYLGSVIARCQFDTFYHEHPRTYSALSFVHISRSLGMPLKNISFPARYGGNIRVSMGGTTPSAKDFSSKLAAILASERHFGSQLSGLQRRVTNWREGTSLMIDSLVLRHGPLQAKAFPGRAAILLTLLDVDTSKISAVYEKPGSMKIGCYVPGCRIPIRSDYDFLNGPHPKLLLNLAWHISDEIRSYLSASGFSGEVIDILRPNEM